MAQKEITPLGIITLALLDELGESHPYEIYQVLLKRNSDRVVKLSTGTLYHTINRLEKCGFVRALGTERSGNRPERTAYEVTAQGIQALHNRVIDLLANPPAEYPVFPIVIGEIHHLAPSTVVSLLQRRVDRLQSARESLAWLDDDEASTVAKRYLLGADYLRMQLDAELAWIQNLIHGIESGAIDWTETDPVTVTDEENS
ncbi:MAG: PadR family transcriptional regulator [Thermomicrobiales bacterium]|nr:PadR family transcriptional regulator [Thermomicrobiales bacterium]